MSGHARHRGDPLRRWPRGRQRDETISTDLGQLPPLLHPIDRVEVPLLIPFGDRFGLDHSLGALVDNQRSALNLIHDLFAVEKRTDERASAPKRNGRGRGAHLGQTAVDERLDAIVADHVVAQADLDDFVLGDGRRHGVE